MTVTTDVAAHSRGEPKPEADKGFWVRCEPCGHCWIAGYYPMEVLRFTEIAKAHASRCPKCGSKQVVVAKQEDGELREGEAA